MRRNPEQIINEQVHHWHLRQSALERSHGTTRPWPVITISREFGAGGAALARLLAERTGFTVWDKELVQVIADETGSDVRILQTLDERRQTAIDDAVRGVLTAHRTNYHYLQSLLRVVHTIVAHGGSIIVGRGAHYICEPEASLRVRVVCPEAQRVRNYAVREGLDLEQARQIVKQREADQIDFILHTFKRDVTSPPDYDLVLNSETYGLDRMADLVLAAYEAKLGRRPYPAMTDTRA